SPHALLYFHNIQSINLTMKRAVDFSPTSPRLVDSVNYEERRLQASNDCSRGSYQLIWHNSERRMGNLCYCIFLGTCFHLEFSNHIVFRQARANRSHLLALSGLPQGMAPMVANPCGMEGHLS